MKKFHIAALSALFVAGGLTAQTKNLELTNEVIDPPEVTHAIPNLQKLTSTATETIDLNSHFKNMTVETDPLSYAIVLNSHSNVATTTLNSNTLEIDYLAAGQTKIIVSAAYNETSTADTFFIGVTPEITGDYETVNFEDLTLQEESVWLGKDGSGSFSSGAATFPNSYNASYESWSGWIFTNTTDTETQSYTNNSAITGGGFDPGNDVYTITNSFMGSYFSFHDSSAHEVLGLYVTNATYAALSMKNGDAFGAKKFGGADGTESDWFKLRFQGRKDGIDTGIPVEFMLSDFSSENSEHDYIVQTWQYLDLTPLGEVDTVFWSLSSTDNGDFGMNTPGYFCIDHLLVVPNATPTVEMPVRLLSIYPNPSSGQFFIEYESDETAELTIFDMSGRMIYRDSRFQNGAALELDTSAGQYILKLVTEKREYVERIVIQ